MYYELIADIVPYKNKYSKELTLVCSLNDQLSRRIGDDKVFISEFVVAKILGYLKHLQGHPEVTKDFLFQLPEFLVKPKEILMRTDRSRERYVICGEKDHRVVLEIERGGKYTEINTIHLIREENLKKLEGKCIKL
jgi:hypothetical protein